MDSILRPCSALAENGTLVANSQRTCRLGSLVAQNESLSSTLEQRDSAFAKQSETLKRYEARLADVDTLVSDKEALEEQVPCCPPSACESVQQYYFEDLRMCFACWSTIGGDSVSGGKS